MRIFTRHNQKNQEHFEETIMAKSTKNSGKRWTPGDKQNLRKLAKGNTPTGVIGLKLSRTENSIRSKASELGISLKPTNQSPYNRRKK
jgi:hypothetical protein